MSGRIYVVARRPLTDRPVHLSDSVVLSFDASGYTICRSEVTCIAVTRKGFFTERHLKGQNDSVPVKSQWSVRLRTPDGRRTFQSGSFQRLTFRIFGQDKKSMSRKA